MESKKLHALTADLIDRLETDFDGNKALAGRELFAQSDNHFKNPDAARTYLRWHFYRRFPKALRQPGEGHTIRVKGNAGTLTGFTSEHIQSEEQLVKAFNIDTEIWYVDTLECGVHEMGYVAEESRDGKGETKRKAKAKPLYRISAKLKRKVDYIIAKQDAEALHKYLRKAAPKWPTITTTRKSGAYELAVPCMLDLHLGKLGWSEEVGENYDLKIAKNRMRKSVEYMIGRMSGAKIERTLFMIGNDFIHADTTSGNKGAFTTSGTPQDLDGRLHKVRIEGRKLLIESINLFAAIAPVDVVTIPGNHDKETILNIADTIDCVYSNTKQVTVDAGPKLRKFYQYGNSGFMMHHGNDLKPPQQAQTFATERSDIWHESKYREIFIGHLHREQQMLSPVNEHGGCILRYLPSLSGHDAWHYSKGFTTNRCASQLLTYSAKTGITNTIPWSPDPEAA